MLTSLRAWMRDHDVDILVVPTLDPHNSEYVAEHWKCRQWLTGFTGSAGTAVVTTIAQPGSPDGEARLWTDSRYWLQADEQLRGTTFRLMREGQDVDIADWLTTFPNARIAFPADMMTAEVYADLFPGLTAHPCADDPFDALWTDRPAFPLSQAEIVSDALAGESAASRLQRFRDAVAHLPQPCRFVNDLSAICWLLNLRGDDIPFNPFLICFFQLHADAPASTLYIDERQLSPEVSSYLADLHVEVRPYAEGLAVHQQFVSEPPAFDGPHPIALMRAVKNPTEQQGFRQAHIHDGVAMVRFLAWLDRQAAEGFAQPVTEIDVDRQLTAFRAEQPGFRGLSFETIAAYGPHGAIVHYEATPETDVPLQPSSLLLLDSGAHYASADADHPFCGTTDITRTIALGPLTDEERRVYTLVLKGHLQLAHLVFPDGTTGLQIDTPARMAMWREGYDYGHGTGHGVGHRLGVHEGPVQIRKNLRACTTLPFHAGQNVTDEPGIYLQGRFGVRIENLLFAVPAAHEGFLRFEQHTLCPYDLRPVIVEMLTPEERRWINDYHARVRETLLPYLVHSDDREWLVAATAAI